MQYIQRYKSPLGSLFLTADTRGLTGLWFDEARYYATHPQKEYREEMTPVLADTGRWLDTYFSGSKPDFIPAIHTRGSAFQMEVWELLMAIPYGSTTTYGALAGIIAQRRGVPRMSAQAVGGAVGSNNISIIIPCHRVIGADGSLVGYGGGMDRKVKLLNLEGRNIPWDRTYFS